jgi:hypothetical protein
VKTGLCRLPSKSYLPIALLFLEPIVLGLAKYSPDTIVFSATMNLTWRVQLSVGRAQLERCWSVPMWEYTRYQHAAVEGWNLA